VAWAVCPPAWATSKRPNFFLLSLFCFFLSWSCIDNAGWHLLLRQITFPDATPRGFSGYSLLAMVRKGDPGRTKKATPGKKIPGKNRDQTYRSMQVMVRRRMGKKSAFARRAGDVAPRYFLFKKKGKKRLCDGCCWYCGLLLGGCPNN